jgi:hypothetical protein
LNIRHLLVALGVLLVVLTWRHAHRPVAHDPGVLVADVPIQEAVDSGAFTLQRDNYSVKPLARFSLSARVLSRADYGWDTESKLAPVDLALGWGRMSDSAVLAKIDIWQSGRFYFWRVGEFPIPEREIIESSANMHLIPADKTVQHEIERTRVGDIVSFDGFLVEVDGPNHYRWISSLTRSDTGAGACELVWVEKLPHRALTPTRVRLRPPRSATADWRCIRRGRARPAERTPVPNKSISESRPRTARR